MTTPNTPRAAEIDEDLIGYEGPLLPQIVFGKWTPPAKDWMKTHFAPWLDDEDEPAQLIGIRSGARPLPDTFVNDFFAAEGPSETNQLIPTAWVNRAIDRELTSTTKPRNDNEATPTETKMNIDNEANIAAETNETEEEKQARLQAELDAQYPVRLATQKEREDVYGIHSSKERDPHDLWICTPHGVPIPVMSSTRKHAQLMAKKAMGWSAR